MKLKWIDWVLIVLLILVAGARFVNIENTIGPYWTGTQQSYMALQMSNGDVPYRDFQHVYPPLGHYMMAGFMNLFGKTLENGSVFVNIMSVITAFIVFLIGRLKSFRIGLIAAFILLITPEFVRNGYYVDVPGVTFLVLSLYLLVRPSENKWQFFAAGVAVAAAVFTKQSFGLFVLASLPFIFFYKKRETLLPYILGGISFAAVAFLLLWWQVESLEFIKWILLPLDFPTRQPISLKYLFIIRRFNILYVLGAALAVHYLFKMIKREEIDDYKRLSSLGFFGFILFLIIAPYFGSHYMVIVAPFFSLMTANEVSKIKIEWKNILKSKFYHLFLIFVLLSVFALGFATQFSKQLFYYPGEHNKYLEVSEYVSKITNETDNVLVDNSAINYYSNRRKTAKLYDTAVAAFSSGYIPKSYVVDAIKREKPKAVVIFDTRLDWLEKENVLKEDYILNKIIYGNRIYILNDDKSADLDLEEGNKVIEDEMLSLLGQEDNFN